MLNLLLVAPTRHAPLIFGHRGSPLASLENTIASYQRAFDDGADGIELDVRATSDGVLVCHHDPWVGAFAYVSRLRYADLLAYYRQRGVDIPTLEQALRQLAGRGVVNIELKIAGMEAVAAALAQRLLPAGSYVFTSFKPAAVQGFRRHAPQVPALLIARRLFGLQRTLMRLRAINASGIALRHPLIDERVLRFFQAHQIPVFAWTVNYLPHARALAAMGVTGLITDFPREMAANFSVHPSRA